MDISRREFMRDAAALACACAASDGVAARVYAQSHGARRLVMLHLNGGNDALSMVVPYTDPFYYRLRPTLAVPPDAVLQIGADAAGRALGLHPRLTGLHRVFNEGHLAVVQRVGCANASRSHLTSFEAWTAPFETPTAQPELTSCAFALPAAACCHRTVTYPDTPLGRTLCDVAGRIERGDNNVALLTLARRRG